MALLWWILAPACWAGGVTAGAAIRACAYELMCECIAAETNEALVLTTNHTVHPLRDATTLHVYGRLIDRTRHWFAATHANFNAFDDDDADELVSLGSLISALVCTCAQSLAFNAQT